MTPMLEASGLGWQHGGRRLVDDISLSLRAGEVVGLIGPNGAGKSSLIRLLAGLQAPSSGTLTLEGRPLRDWPANQRARRIGYLPQSFAPHWDVTLAELLRLWPVPLRARVRSGTRSSASSARTWWLMALVLTFSEVAA